MNMSENDIVIIGAGAAGLAAAVTLKKRDPRLSVIVLEKAAKAGKKILVSGNGRCNLSNVGAAPEYYNNPSFLEDFFRVYNYAYIEKFYRDIGLLIRYRDAEGRAYPAPNSAASVMGVYNAALKKYGAGICFGAEAIDITKNQKGYTVKTASGAEYACSRVIYAAGSPAGDRKADECAMRHPIAEFVKIVPLRPSLCPLKGEKKELKHLENIRVRCAVSGLGREESGEAQFRKDSLSGIVIFNFAAFLARRRLENAVLSLDLFPETGADELSGFIFGQRRNAETASGTLAGLCVNGIAKNILTRLGIPFNAPAASLTAEQAVKIARTLKDYRFKVWAESSFSEAQAASGGVDLSEIDGLSFAVKKHPGLYVAGEALDIDGECGGFNLHFAVCSGIAAANHILKAHMLRD